MKRTPGARRIWVMVFYCVCLDGCSQAPAYDVMGSLFPAWLVCIATGGLLSLIARIILLRLRVNLPFPFLAYPCLAAVFTFSIWLIFY
jgi:hypothetical protein